MADLVEKTGFSADQGSILDTSLNTSSSVNAHEPATKYMKVAMCVVPQSRASAGFEPQRETVEVDDSVSNVSIANSSSSQILLLECKVRESKARAKAAALELQVREDERILAEAKYEHSNRSHASSRRSRRRPDAVIADVDQIVDNVFDLSRELSFIVKEGGCDDQPPVITDANREPEERAQTDIVSTTASSMPILSAGLNHPALPTPGLIVRMSDIVQQASNQPGIPNPVIFIGKGPETPEVNRYGPARGRVKSQSPFSRSQSPKPAAIPKQAKQVDVEAIKSEVTAEAVNFLQQLQNRIASDHREELTSFERDAERTHEIKMNEKKEQYESVAELRHGEIMSVREQEFQIERQRLMSEKDALVNAERERLQNIGHLEIERAKHTLERQAAIKIADFESNMIAAQQEAERAKHEAANAYREKEELAKQVRIAEDKARENANRTRIQIAELEQRVKAAEQAKSPGPDMFYIGESRKKRDEAPSRLPSPETRSSDRGGGTKLFLEKGPRPPKVPARVTPSPDDRERERGRHPGPKVITTSLTTTTGAKTTVHSGRSSGDPDDDDKGGSGRDDHDKSRKDRKKEDKKDDRKDPPKQNKRPPDDDDGSSSGSSDDDDDDDSSSSGGSDDVGGVSADERKSAKLLRKMLSQRKSGKEADKVILPAVSDAPAFRAWRVTARTNVVAASGMGERAFKWYCEIERPGMTFKRLYKTGSKFANLDAKILSAVTDKAHGELGREITQKIEEYARKGKMLRGRQAVWLIYQYMNVSEQAGALYDISDLMGVRLYHDKLEPFLQSWQAVLTGMRSPPDPETQEVLFYKQLQTSDQMKTEIAHYERNEIGHPDHSYEFLLAAVKRRIQKRRQDKNRKALEAALGGSKIPAAPAKGKGKGKTGICYAFRDKGKCDREDCPYQHSNNAMPAKGSGKRGRSRSPKGKGRGRSNSPKGKGKGISRERSSSDGKQVCWFFMKGHCKFGDKCNNKHSKPAAPATKDKDKHKNKKKRDNTDSETDSVRPEQKTKAKPKAAATPAVRGPGPIGRAVLAASMLVTAFSQQFACPALCERLVPSGFKDLSYDCTAPSFPTSNATYPQNKNYKNVGVRFGNADTVHIAVYGQGRKFWISPRKPEYEHSSYIKRLDTKGSERDAICKAVFWHEQVIGRVRPRGEVYIEVNRALNARDARIEASMNATAMPAVCKPTRWLADTGAASDLVSFDAVDKRYITKAKDHEQVTLYTANGPIDVDKKVQLKIGKLGHADVLLLDETPAVFSIGKRVMNEGYSFVWKNNRQPYLIDSKGIKIPLEVEGDIPYLIDDSKPSYACPVPAESAEEAPSEHEQQEEVPSSGDAEGELGESEKPESKNEKLKREACSLSHLMTHMPQNPFCETCRAAKLRKAQARKIKLEDRRIAKTFGERVHADHVFPKDINDSDLDGNTTALVLKDDATEFRGFYPQTTKGADKSAASLRHFIGPKNKLVAMRSDNSRELIKTAKLLRVHHEQSTPYRSESNARIERDIGVDVNGIRCNLTQSGLPLSFWPQAGQHFAHYTNCLAPCREGKSISDLPPAAMTPWRKRFKEDWNGPVHPFGCLVRFRPYNANETLPKFAPRTVEGVFLGVFLQPGHKYSGDVLVATLESFQTSDRIQICRIKEAEVRFPLVGVAYTFPIAEARKLSSIAKIRQTLENFVDVVPEIEDVDVEIPDDPDQPIDEVEVIDEDCSCEETPNDQSGGSSSSTSEIKLNADEGGKKLPAQEIDVKKHKGPVGRPATKRPPHWTPEAWGKLSKKQRENEYTKYNKTSDTCPAMTVNEYIPAMPVIATTPEHREKVQSLPPLYNACVARSLTKADMMNSPKGRAAQDLEWGRLRKIGAWNESKVREWGDVVAEAKRTGKKHHVGRVFEVNVIKGDELPEGDPGRKYKCRVVFQGNNVRDENSQQAMFLELSSCPATMEAAKAADIYGLLSGNETQQCDAEQAYVQAKLGGKLLGGATSLDEIPQTWVRLPREQWPKAWSGFKDPVCPLVLALYGHPEAGGWWEDHSKQQLEAVGFQEIPDWKSCFWHDKLKLFLVVYVDDFKMSGPKDALVKGWEMIRARIKTEPPTLACRYLGCEHQTIEKEIIRNSNPFTRAGCESGQNDKVKVRAMVYNMSNFLKSCVDRYLELAKCERNKLRKVATPFLDDSKTKRENDDDDLQWPLSLAGKSTEKPKGEIQPSAKTLADVACKILMKILYAARMARYDLLKAVSVLASKVSKWDETCDLELHRLVSYINSTIDLTMVSYIGDSKDELNVRLYTDADFAGDNGCSKSTSGTFLCISGPNSSAPLSGQSKKQSAVSHSTPEAEIIAADHGVRSSGLPALALWEKLLERRLVLQLQEDNSAAKRVVETGRNPTMRHLNRTHKVDLRFLHEQVERGNMTVVQCPTLEMSADIFTKAFTSSDKWTHALNLICHSKPNDIQWYNPRPMASSGTRIPAAPAKPRCSRVIIEFCCGENSKIGNEAPLYGCRSERLTIREDMRSQKGLEHALNIVRDAHSRNEMILLWGAIPCTGGSAWQNYNRQFPSAAAKIRIHLRNFCKLFRNFKAIAREVILCGGIVVNEWPTGCSYWKRYEVTKFLAETGMNKVNLDGCMFDLKSVVYEDKYIKKPWTLASNNQSFLEQFESHKCIGESDKHKHTPCAGKDTRLTENYTDQFARHVHHAFAFVESDVKGMYLGSHETQFAACCVPISKVRKTKVESALSHSSVGSGIKFLANSTMAFKAQDGCSFPVTAWQEFFYNAARATLKINAPADELHLSSVRLPNPMELYNLCSKILSRSSIINFMTFEDMKALIDPANAGVEATSSGYKIPAPPVIHQSLTTFRVLVVGDSALELKRNKSWSTNQEDLRWRSGNKEAVVVCLPGRKAADIIKELRTRDVRTYEAVHVFWTLNDLMVNDEWRDEIPGLDEIINDFDQATKGAMNRHFTIGGDGHRWGAPQSYDMVRDLIRCKLSNLGITSDTGKCFFANLIVGERDKWHAISNDANRETMSTFMLNVADFMRLTTIPKSKQWEIASGIKFADSGASSSTMGGPRRPAPGVPQTAYISPPEVVTVPTPPTTQKQPEEEQWYGHIAAVEEYGRPGTYYRKIGFPLVQILRHNANRYPEFEMRSDGFMLIDDAMEILRKYHGVRSTRDQIFDCVRNSDKQRFQLWVPNAGVNAQRMLDGRVAPTHIRAAQGHTLKNVISDHLHGNPIDIKERFQTDFVYHGTSLDAMSKISQFGIVPGGMSGRRNEVHMSPYHQKDSRCVAGMRFDSEILIKLSVETMKSKGIRIFAGSAGALLSPDRIPPEAIETVEISSSGAIIFDQEKKKPEGDSEAESDLEAFDRQIGEAKLSAPQPSYKSFESDDMKVEGTGLEGTSRNVKRQAAPADEDKDAASSGSEQIQPRIVKYIPNYVVDIDPSSDEEIVRRPRASAERRNRWGVLIPDDEDQERRTAEAVVNDLQKTYGVTAEWIKTKRGATRTEASMTVKRFKALDRKAKNHGFEDYESRFDGDQWFREAMLARGWDRDMRQRLPELATQKGKAFGKAAKGKMAKSGKGGEKQGGPYRPADRQGKGWGQGWSSASSSGSAAWTAATAWSASVWTGNADSLIIKQDGTMVMQGEIPSSFFFYFKIFAAITIFTVLLFVIAYIARGLIRAYSWIRSLFFGYAPYSLRTVGVQSQCTYDGERFRAYQNGFRRAGEIEVILHETDPRKLKYD